MKHLARLCVCGLALALPAVGWADGGFDGVDSARNFGEITGRYYTSVAYNTAACNVRKVQLAEESLAEIFLAAAGLRTSDTRREKLAYYLGLYAGWTAQRQEEYESCPSYHFRKVPLDVEARAAATILLMIEEEFTHLVRRYQSDILEEFSVEYGPDAYYSVVERNQCEIAFFEAIGVPTYSLRGIFLDQVAEVVCR